MHQDPIEQLLAGAISTLTIKADGTTAPDDPPAGVILSGAFNPLHSGHRELARAAARLTGLPESYELAVVNADKGALDAGEIKRRAAQFSGWATLTLSRAPLFAQKASLYPGRSFALGYDTVARLLNPRYYAESGLDAALDSLAAHGCRLIVAGRLVDGVFRTLEDLAIPAEHADLFVAIPEALFRADISSSELRAASR
jgi:hypothetical protein